MWTTALGKCPFRRRFEVERNYLDPTSNPATISVGTMPEPPNLIGPSSDVGFGLIGNAALRNCNILVKFSNAVSEVKSQGLTQTTEEWPEKLIDTFPISHCISWWPTPSGVLGMLKPPLKFALSSQKFDHSFHQVEGGLESQVESNASQTEAKSGPTEPSTSSEKITEESW
ncbi:hypothetical protein C8R47DRAFT_1081164 [Mycena vitilis]|nr:hypothetical protein C8R47DRAFT_1081164 [Mycena vitilis]